MLKGLVKKMILSVGVLRVRKMRNFEKLASYVAFPFYHTPPPSIPNLLLYTAATAAICAGGFRVYVMCCTFAGSLKM